VTPSVAVFGAAGYGGALSARLLHRHPGFDLVTVTARSDVGRRLGDVYPRHRVPLVWTATAPSTPRSSPTRTAPPPSSCPRSSLAGSAWWT
jgi:N-acetyl-gamma-glutamylphosphate reductase